MKGSVFWGVVGAFALFLAGLIAFGSVSDRADPSPPVSIQATAACADLIRKNARDPASVSFVTDPEKTPAVHLSVAGIQQKHTWDVSLLTRANNGFGGKTVSMMQCHNLYESEGGRWSGDMEELAPQQPRLPADHRQ